VVPTGCCFLSWLSGSLFASRSCVFADSWPRSPSPVAGDSTSRRAGLARLVLEDGSQRSADDLKVQGQALVAEVEELVLQLLESV